jgi:hypothetical protein
MTRNSNPNRGNSRKTKENPMKSILPGLLTGSLLLSAAMVGETGPSTGAVAKDVPLGYYVVLTAAITAMERNIQ